MLKSSLNRTILVLWAFLCGIPIVGYIAALIVFDFGVSRGNVIALIAMMSFFTLFIAWVVQRQKALDGRHAERQREAAARIAEQERREAQEATRLVG